MKLESLNMNLKSLKSHLNNQKGRFYSGKIEKSSVTFRKNKPNVKIGNITISSLMTNKYAKMAKNQSSIINNHLKSKPNQTQNKPNSNPIPERPKMNVRNAITINYETFPHRPGKKTNPIQTQANPIPITIAVPATLIIDETLHPAYNHSDNF